MFSSFDYPRTVKHVSITEGYTASDGSWVAEVTSETSISAHVSDLTWKERQFLDEEIIEHGARKLAVDASLGIVVGDRIKITEVDTTETTWFVHSRMYESNLMKKFLNVSRETFLIARK